MGLLPLVGLAVLLLPQKVEGQGVQISGIATGQIPCPDYYELRMRHTSATFMVRNGSGRIRGPFNGDKA